MTGYRRHWPWLCALLALAAGPAFAAGDAPKEASEPLFVAQILVLILAGRLLGEAMLRFKQPAVMGQLIAGLMLGPSLFGAILPHWQQALFPAAQEQKAMLAGVAQFGILLLLLLTGMETDLKLVRQTGRASVLASLAGIAVPFTPIEILRKAIAGVTSCMNAASPIAGGLGLIVAAVGPSPMPVGPWQVTQLVL